MKLKINTDRNPEASIVSETNPLQSENLQDLFVGDQIEIEITVSDSTGLVPFWADDPQIQLALGIGDAANRETYTDTIALERSENVFTCILDLQTAKIKELVQTSTSALADLEIIFYQGQTVRTIYQKECILKKEIISNAGFPSKPSGIEVSI